VWEISFTIGACFDLIKGQWDMVTDLEKYALKFATKAHGDQTRKYDGQPYIVHPVAVADIVRSVSHTPEMITAALLHDTVEDTPVTLDDIRSNFGGHVARLVAWLTDVATKHHGNRAMRMELNRLHLSLAPAEAKTIKLADLIDNSASIMRHDRGFWPVYREEKVLLLPHLTAGNRLLWERAARLVKQ
jgi:(p)ppGpp synthase/HD superfamily hydrolase